MKKNQYGFGIVEIIIIVVVLAVLGLIAWRVISAMDEKEQQAKLGPQSQLQSENQGDGGQGLMWQRAADGWKPMQTPPGCPAQPILKTPTDLSKVTSVLYPGQTRGQYKPHGGFRFDTIKDNKVTVTAPFDGYVVTAVGTFAEGTTEVQYGLNIMSNCGIAMSLGHLLELSPDMQKIADQLPEPSADSRDHSVNPPVFVKQGQVIATKVGLESTGNTFFDWGVYDYRQQNEVSKTAAYQAAHPRKDHSWYAVCWIQDGWLPSSDQAKLAGLPAGGGENGKTSDYCK